MRALGPTSIALAIVLTVAAASAAATPAITVLEPVQNTRIYHQELVAPNGGMSPPRAIQFSAPGYTPEALARNIEGVVTFVAEFDTEGNFTVLHTAKRLGHGLDEKALEALLQWRFESLPPSWLTLRKLLRASGELPLQTYFFSSGSGVLSNSAFTPFLNSHSLSSASAYIG